MPNESDSPVFPKQPHTLRPEPKLKPEKRPKVPTRDTREDRGARQAKTVKNTQTLSHGK